MNFKIKKATPAVLTTIRGRTETILFDSVIPGRKKEAIDEYSRRLLEGPSFAAGSDGLYTWILGDDRFVAAPVTNSQEIGSLHINIAFWSGIDSPDAAGELRKTGREVDYNLKSSTFMEQVIHTEADVDARVLETNAALRALDLVPTFLRCKPEGTQDCAEDFEQLSGKDLLTGATIVTPIEESLTLRTFFMPDEETDEEGTPSAGDYAAATEALGGEDRLKGGSRRGRSPRTRRRRSTRSPARARGGRRATRRSVRSGRHVL